MKLVCDYPSALEFLLRRINYERMTNIPYCSTEFKLDRMRQLLALVGDPHLSIKAVHIAGTKGKGSTAAMMAAVLRAAGYRTGLYTSPHLERIEERIVIDGGVCTECEFANLAAELEQATGELDGEPVRDSAAGPTFFEITTAMAFLHFARANVDLAVLEVGLGGRLDSTNVCQPEVSIITSISFDHTRQLGGTLAAIAGEKAGIIKPGVPVISGVVADEPRLAIAERALSAGAPLVQCGVDYGFGVRGSGFRSQESVDRGQEVFDYFEPVNEPHWELRDVRLDMLGSHQAANAAAAIAAAGRLRERGWSISDEALRLGLAAARCPARIELVASHPAVVLDVAHNLASIEALLAVLREQFEARRRILIFASSKDKDYAGMLRLLAPAFDAMIFTRYIHNPRAMEPGALLAVTRELPGKPSDHGEAKTQALQETADPAGAWRLAKKMAGPDDLICATGSFFLAAELRPLMMEGKVENHE